MSETACLVIRAAEVERFHADGVIVLRGAFLDWVEKLGAGVSACLPELSTQ